MLYVGRLLVVAGAVIIAAGLALLLAGHVPFLGKLPGDIRLRGEGWTFYLPLTTCVVLSLVLTLLLNVILRLFFRE